MSPRRATAGPVTLLTLVLSLTACQASHGPISTRSPTTTAIITNSSSQPPISTPSATTNTPASPTNTPPERHRFATPIVDDLAARTTNLKLACQALDGRVVEPDATLSFNDTVGARTPERGYRLAKVYIDGEKVDEYGGGICQVATTLYNAALAAGWQAVEHHPHGGDKPIPYAQDIEDATVYYGELDLKLKNTGDHPVTLHAAVRDQEVVVELVPQ